MKVVREVLIAIGKILLVLTMFFLAAITKSCINNPTKQEIINESKDIRLVHRDISKSK